MAAPPRHPPNMEQFEAYFQTADLDRDGRISGAEAVAFFQGSGLPRNILAQIWQYSNTKNADFLGREEFYNALRLVTVAQTGRQLTRDIVTTALGPTASKIPAPQIKVIAAAPLSAAPLRTHPNSMTPPVQIGRMPQASQTSGLLGATTQVSAAGVTQPQSRPETTRPSISMQTVSQGVTVGTNMIGPTVTSSSPIKVPSFQGFPRPGNMINPRPPISSNTSLSTNWFSGQTGGALSDGSNAQIINQGFSSAAKQDVSGPVSTGQVFPSAVGSSVTVGLASLSSKVPGQVSISSHPADKDPKVLVTSGNGFSSGSMFGGEEFSVTQQKQAIFSSSPPSNKPPTTSTVSPVIMGVQTLVKPAQSFPPSTSTESSFSFPILSTQQLTKQSQLASVPAPSPPNVSGTLASTTTQSQWPKMTKSDIQKYTKVFVEVDKDRDGKISGEQARNLFLSWRLPREVLKQVWDLSDQDGDSMLSLREFCIALYLMERYREGRPIPSSLSNNIIFDDALLQATGQAPATYGGSQWHQGRGFSSQGMPGVRPATDVDMSKPPRQAQDHAPVNTQAQPAPKRSAVPVLEKHLLDQLSNEEQSTLDSKLKEAMDADKKVEDLEKEILEANAKIEFYRSKMQELVLYKSRCDTRLIEVMEKVSSNKHEYEVFAKKYEEKCKQVGDVASKLTIEEATFREIQDRKLKLYNSIVKLDSGSASNSLKEQAEQLQSDLEELVRSLNDRCKQYGLRTKPTSLVELPFGWQPGIQEGAADWDEDWDKFQDEGFELVKELTVDVQNMVVAPKSKSPSASNDTHIKDDPLLTNSFVDGNSKETRKSFVSEHDVKTETTDMQNEEKVERSPPSSPLAKEGTSPTSPLGKGATYLDSPGKDTREITSPKFDSLSFRTDDGSPHSKDFHSEQDSIEPDRLDNKQAQFSWDPAFDTRDEPEPIWNLHPDEKVTSGESKFASGESKFASGESKFDESFFGAGDFVLNPIKTGAPSSAQNTGKDKSSFFSDSIPATPVNDFGYEKNFFADSVPATPFYNSVFSPRFNDTPRMGSPTMANEFGQKEKISSFADSVPGTPHYNSVFSPRFSEGADMGFDNLSRFDSFSMQGSMSRFDSFNAQGSMSRFDSFNAQGSMSRFDSFNAQPNLSRFDSMRSNAASDFGGPFAQNETFQRFDSMRSTGDSDHNSGFFNDADPFGTGPFKPLDSTTPKHSGNWSAF